MMLLPKSQAKKLPRLYETEHMPTEDKVAITKLFHPWSNWTWYIIEFDGDDLCWGLVSGHETEFGYFSLSELSKVEYPFGIAVERDVFFRPTRVEELAAFGKGGVVY
jgi:hypothetical protein